MFGKSFIRRGRFACLFVLLAAAQADARLVPATQTASPVPDVQVFDGAGRSDSIRSMLAGMGTGPIVILPIYARCAASCPLQTQKIKQVWNNLMRRSPVRVLAFSFDPAETAASIADYRRREAVPDGWAVVHARETEARTFFDFFRYSVVGDDGQFVHPDRIFLLDRSLQWRFTMDGLNYRPEEMESALAQLQSPGPGLWLRTNPELIAWAGLACILISIGMLAFWRIGHKSSRQSAAAKS